MIELTISEVDRQEAGFYTDTHCCLIATALMNRGYNVRSVGPATIRFEDNEVHHMTGGAPGALRAMFDPQDGPPFYEPEVVGHVVRIHGIGDKSEKPEEKPALVTT